ncbi:MAG TPA: helix-turn-helix transcriptional regulator [Verrucomicrobiae bacterium]|nr:helix-turn-helix transcriptional regulator [Verrucomicrobiae bacterium]
MRESASITFKKRLRELRETLRWTQKKAAKTCKLSLCLYQLYELGIKKNPGLLTLEKIAKGFGIEVYDLLLLKPAGVRKRFNSPKPKRKQSRRTHRNAR